MTDPIVMGRKPASVSASNESGTAVKMMEMTMSAIGTYAIHLSAVSDPGTRNGRGVFASSRRSFKNAGNTGR